MIVSPDNFRMIDGKYVFDKEKEAAVWKTAYRFFYHSLQDCKKGCLLIGPPGSGKSTWLNLNEDPNTAYFDATNTKKEERRVLLTLGAVLDCPMTGLYFKTPLSTCLERNATRSEDRCIPEAIIAQMHLNLVNHNPTHEEGFSSLINVELQ